MNRAIVTTTINEPTRAMKKYLEIAKSDGWYLIVVGDKKTKYKEWIELEKQNSKWLFYLDPSDQENISKELSDLIGWNCIQRRNFGFLKAKELGVEYIATVDDDNIPTSNWGKDIVVNKYIDVNLYINKNDNLVNDPLSVFNYPIWHRGFPLTYVNTKNNIKKTGTKRVEVKVQANLWNGDPDIDAIQRLSSIQKKWAFSYSGYYGFNGQSPFNSQNTIISMDILPYYMCLPHIGRMDDIWGGYLLQEKFPNCLVYGDATVYQERNDHNYYKDFLQEVIGYTTDFCNIKLGNMPAKTQDAYLLYVNLMGGINE